MERNFAGDTCNHGDVTVRQAIRTALSLLSPRDRRLLRVSIAIQAALSLLDLAGILLIGLVGALAVTTVQSQPPPFIAANFAEQLGLGELSPQALVVVLAAVAAVVLLTKSVLSSLLSRRVFAFLANRQAHLSARLAKELLARPLSFIQRHPSQQTAFALINGANAATTLLLGQYVVAVSELALLMVLGTALLFLSPLVAIGAIAFFTVVALGLQRAMGDWAARVGQEASEADIASFGTVQEAIGAYREIAVANRRSFYVDRIQALRWRAAQVSADAQFMGMFPKYMFEVALVLGGFALAGALFATQDSVTAVGTLALFLAAGTRVMPSLLRLQGAALGMRTAAGLAEPTFALAAELGKPPDTPVTRSTGQEIPDRVRSGSQELDSSIRLESVSVVYPGSSRRALDDISLSIAAGQSVALVGPSGAGKSTLVDVILGVLKPTSGTALVGGMDPSACVERWPGAVAYVPQDTFLANGTVRYNVALGLSSDAIDDDLVWAALRRAHLDEYLSTQREGLDTIVGEKGLRLSGGQRQRLGIARALYARPRLIVLDEATSALDAETEQAVTNTMSELQGDVTRVLIAHRLSTVRGVDMIVYLEDGRILATGDFEEVLRKVPAFERQAQLTGIVMR